MNMHKNKFLELSDFNTPKDSIKQLSELISDLECGVIGSNDFWYTIGLYTSALFNEIAIPYTMPRIMADFSDRFVSEFVSNTSLKPDTLYSTYKANKRYESGHFYLYWQEEKEKRQWHKQAISTYLPKKVKGWTVFLPFMGSKIRFFNSSNVYNYIEKFKLTKPDDDEFEYGEEREKLYEVNKITSDLEVYSGLATTLDDFIYPEAISLKEFGYTLNKLFELMENKATKPRHSQIKEVCYAGFDRTLIYELLAYLSGIYLRQLFQFFDYCKNYTVRGEADNIGVCNGIKYLKIGELQEQLELLFKENLLARIFTVGNFSERQRYELERNPLNHTYLSILFDLYPDSVQTFCKKIILDSIISPTTFHDLGVERVEARDIVNTVINNTKIENTKHLGAILALNTFMKNKEVLHELTVRYAYSATNTGSRGQQLSNYITAVIKNSPVQEIKHHLTRQSNLNTLTKILKPMFNSFPFKGE